MKLERRIAEAEMVAVFLQGEIDAAVYGEEMLRLLDRDGRGREIIDRPDTGDEDENRYRARLLGEVRGYGRNRDVFTGMPDGVEWFRAALEPGDLDALLYIDYDYFTDFTGGTRRVKDAVKRIRAGEIGFDEVGHFLSLAETVRRGARFPEAILLHNPASGELVILEGHKRMTAYLLLSDPPPPDLLRVIVGRSEKIAK